MSSEQEKPEACRECGMATLPRMSDEDQSTYRCGSTYWHNSQEFEQSDACLIAALRQKVERLEGALGIYANPDNWLCSLFGEYHEHGDGKCLKDCFNLSDNGWEAALSALRQEEGTKQ